MFLVPILYTIFQLIPNNLLIVSIWFLTFYYCFNLVPAVVFWMKINIMFNGQKKKKKFPLM